MTPLEIEVLLHAYSSPSDFPRSAPAISEAYGTLQRNGLIYLDGENIYQATDRGKAHVSQLCSLPFPRQVYVDNWENIIAFD